MSRIATPVEWSADLIRQLAQCDAGCNFILEMLTAGDEAIDPARTEHVDDGIDEIYADGSRLSWRSGICTEIVTLS